MKLFVFFWAVCKFLWMNYERYKCFEPVNARNPHFFLTLITKNADSIFYERSELIMINAIIILSTLNIYLMFSGIWNGENCTMYIETNFIHTSSKHKAQCTCKTPIENLIFVYHWQSLIVLRVDEYIKRFVIDWL